MKICSQCKNEKPINDFRRASSEKDGHQHACKSCQTAKRKEWNEKNPGLAREKAKILRAKNPDKHNAHTTRWRKNNPDKVKDSFLKKKYGIGIVEWKRLFEIQEGRCKICNTHQSELKKDLAVDHCHKTNKVRGLLCVRCNRAIGLLEDDPVLLDKSSSYLKSAKSSS